MAIFDLVLCQNLICCRVPQALPVRSWILLTEPVAPKFLTLDAPLRQRDVFQDVQQILFDLRRTAFVDLDGISKGIGDIATSS
jgi:hypothetical protein